MVMNILSVRNFVFAVVMATCQTLLAQIPGIGPVGEIQKLHTGFGFTEGPAEDADGNIFFTDIPNARIHQIAPNGELTIFQENSGHANGLMVDSQGNLVKCEMDGQISRVSIRTKTQTTLAPGYNGHRFNACNDLVIDRQGGIYFTDPHFRAPEPLPQSVTAVYYLAADGKVTRLIDNLKAPNGIILSPNEKTLYVVPSGQSEVMAYAVQSPGKIDEGKVLVSLKQPEGVTGSGGDGLTVDEQGNLYVTAQLGVQVISPAGEILGVIEFPEQPANVTFVGTDRKTLFVTARTSVHIAPMEASGHRFATE